MGQSAELALKPRLAIYSRTRFFRTRHTTLLNINKHRIKLEINHYRHTERSTNSVSKPLIDYVSTDSTDSTDFTDRLTDRQTDRLVPAKAALI